VRESASEYRVARNVPPPSREPATEARLLDYIEGYVAAQGFTFPPLAVRDYYVALKTKPFAILAGLSGTGKTRLTELFAEALTGDVPGQYRLLAVRPDWTDPSPLLGYHNVLTGEYVATPLLDLLRAAGQPENRARAFFVCFDEMNLARVEHYLADLLSAMETRRRELTLANGPAVALSPNVFLSARSTWTRRRTRSRARCWTARTPSSLPASNSPPARASVPRSRCRRSPHRSGSGCSCQRASRDWRGPRRGCRRSTPRSRLAL
jgi:hypothetical protein